MIIGITTTYNDDGNFERVNREYVARVAETGAIPVLLPPVGADEALSIAAAREMLGSVDALVLSGGGDIQPHLYGENAVRPETNTIHPERDALEMALARLAFDEDKPVLGVCRGVQTINVAMGGTLYQDVRACGVTARNHLQNPPYGSFTQTVRINHGSLLSRILACTHEGWHPDEMKPRENVEQAWLLETNSIHHQAVRDVAPGFEVSARSDDGVIEAIEAPGKRFFLGVQWHPEYLPDHHALFHALAQAVRAD